MATRRKTSSTKSSASKRSVSRLAPGSGGEGDYYHVEVRPRKDFVSFRTQDVGDPGHIQRVAGRRETGSWGTVKWLIGKEDAHVDGDRLVGDTKDAKDLIKKLGSTPVHKKSDIFEAKPLKNVAERSKSTSVQKKARTQNTKKAQAAKRKSK
jgi:hypothetical protein